ncbi:MAG: zinc metallopeptidase [Coriobacteriia bacterium]|nr:zinc metallopeptidase [Coriobacteriia bacterium]
MFLDSQYILIMLVAMVLGFITQGYVNSTYRKWSQVPLMTGRTGAEVARTMLDSEGLHAVGIETVPGHLTDHYDPRTNVLRLSTDVYSGRSVAAAGVAAHEAGHAVQHARGYVPAKIRMALVPVANLGSGAAWVLIFIGLAIGFLQLAWLGVAAFATAVLFQLVTLPVEFNASGHALRALSTTGALQPQQVSGARNVLTAAALTYIAAALISVMQLFYWMSVVGRRN